MQLSFICFVKINALVKEILRFFRFFLHLNMRPGTVRAPGRIYYFDIWLFTGLFVVFLFD